MEKLTIKHLAPYLPYGLEIKTNLGVRIMSPQHSDNLEVAINSVILYPFKPLLRPLSDLTKEIEHNGTRFVPKSLLATKLMKGINANYKIHLGMWSYKDIEKLFEWHFDIFGLIDEGLAIKKQTLNHE